MVARLMLNNEYRWIDSPLRDTERGTQLKSKQYSYTCFLWYFATKLVLYWFLESPLAFFFLAFASYHSLLLNISMAFELPTEQDPQQLMWNLASKTHGSCWNEVHVHVVSLEKALLSKSGIEPRTLALKVFSSPTTGLHRQHIGKQFEPIRVEYPKEEERKRLMSSSPSWTELVVSSVVVWLSCWAGSSSSSSTMVTGEEEGLGTLPFSAAAFSRVSLFFMTVFSGPSNTLSLSIMLLAMFGCESILAVEEEEDWLLLNLQGEDSERGDSVTAAITLKQHPKYQTSIRSRPRM